MSVQPTITQEEFMTTCVADGTARDVCEARWKAANEISPEVAPPVIAPGDANYVAGLLRQIEMKDAQIETRERQLRQAIDIADRANDERKAKEEGEKLKLINSIQLDAPFSKDDLKKKSLPDLYTMRYTLDKGLQKTFASVAAEMDAAKRKPKPTLTAGYFDAATKTWKGGM